MSGRQSLIVLGVCLAVLAFGSLLASAQLSKFQEATEGIDSSGTLYVPSGDGNYRWFVQSELAPTGSFDLVFQAKAKHSVCVGIFRKAALLDANAYDIIFRNKQVSIGNQQPVPSLPATQEIPMRAGWKRATATEDLTSGDQFITYWISVGPKIVQVGLGSEPGVNIKLSFFKETLTGERLAIGFASQRSELWVKGIWTKAISRNRAVKPSPYAESSSPQMERFGDGVILRPTLGAYQKFPLMFSRDAGAQFDIRFKLRSAGEFRVAFLKEQISESNEGFELSIGETTSVTIGTANSSTSTTSVTAELASVKLGASPISASQFNQYWVSMKSGSIEFGRGTELDANEIIEAHDARIEGNMFEFAWAAVNSTVEIKDVWNQLSLKALATDIKLTPTSGLYNRFLHRRVAPRGNFGLKFSIKAGSPFYAGLFARPGAKSTSAVEIAFESTTTFFRIGTQFGRVVASTNRSLYEGMGGFTNLWISMRNSTQLCIGTGDKLNQNSVLCTNGLADKLGVNLAVGFASLTADAFIRDLWVTADIDDFNVAPPKSVSLAKATSAISYAYLERPVASSGSFDLKFQASFSEMLQIGIVRDQNTGAGFAIYLVNEPTSLLEEDAEASDVLFLEAIGQTAQTSATSAPSKTGKKRSVSAATSGGRAVKSSASSNVGTRPSQAKGKQRSSTGNKKLKQSKNAKPENRRARRKKQEEKWVKLYPLVVRKSSGIELRKMVSEKVAGGRSLFKRKKKKSRMVAQQTPLKLNQINMPKKFVGLQNFWVSFRDGELLVGIGSVISKENAFLSTNDPSIVGQDLSVGFLSSSSALIKNIWVNARLEEFDQQFVIAPSKNGYASFLMQTVAQMGAFDMNLEIKGTSLNIGFFESALSMNPTFEIALSNTRPLTVSYRPSDNDQPREIAKAAQASIFSKLFFRDFWIAYKPGYLAVGSGEEVGKKVLIQVNDEKIMKGSNLIMAFSVNKRESVIRQLFVKETVLLSASSPPRLFDKAATSAEFAMTFTAMAAGDLKIGISRSPDSSSKQAQGQSLWIVLGAFFNSKIAINNGVNMVKSVDAANLLSRDTFRPFWIRARNGILSVGKGADVGANVLIEYSLGNWFGAAPNAWFSFATLQDGAAVKEIKVSGFCRPTEDWVQITPCMPMCTDGFMTMEADLTCGLVNPTVTKVSREVACSTQCIYQGGLQALQLPQPNPRIPLAKFEFAGGSSQQQQQVGNGGGAARALSSQSVCLPVNELLSAQEQLKQAKATAAAATQELRKLKQTKAASNALTAKSTSAVRVLTSASNHNMIKGSYQSASQSGQPKCNCAGEFQNIASKDEPLDEIDDGIDSADGKTAVLIELQNSIYQSVSKPCTDKSYQQLCPQSDSLVWVPKFCKNRQTSCIQTCDPRPKLTVKCESPFPAREISMKSSMSSEVIKSSTVVSSPTVNTP